MSDKKFRARKRDNHVRYKKCGNAANLKYPRDEVLGCFSPEKPPELSEFLESVMSAVSLQPMLTPESRFAHSLGTEINPRKAKFTEKRQEKLPEWLEEDAHSSLANSLHPPEEQNLFEEPPDVIPIADFDETFGKIDVKIEEKLRIPEEEVPE